MYAEGDISISSVDLIEKSEYTEISEKSKLCYKEYNSASNHIEFEGFYEYPKGMTWNEFYNSEYDGWLVPFSGIFSNTEELTYKEEIYFGKTSTEKIKRKSMGCYYNVYSYVGDDEYPDGGFD